MPPQHSSERIYSLTDDAHRQDQFSCTDQLPAQPLAARRERWSNLAASASCLFGAVIASRAVYGSTWWLLLGLLVSGLIFLLLAIVGMKRKRTR